jgi:hypothetical protein
VNWYFIAPGYGIFSHQHLSLKDFAQANGQPIAFDGLLFIQGRDDDRKSHFLSFCSKHK